MFLRLRIATRMTLLIFLGTGAILAAVSLSDYFAARRILEEELQGKARYLARSTAREMEVIKRAVEKVIEEMAVVLRTQPLEIEKLYEILETTVITHDEIYGSAVVVLPTALDSDQQEVAIPYVHREGQRVARADLARGDYPFETLDWYLLPRELRAPVWTEPYYDEGGGESLMVTYSVPVVAGPEGRLQGIVTGDLSLDWLDSMVAGMELDSGGEAFLISRNGRFVSFPARREFVMHETLFSIAERYDNEEMRRVGQSMTRGDRGFVEFHGFRDGQDLWLAYAPVLDTGWSLGAIFPQDQISAKLVDLSRLNFVLGGLGALGMIAVALGVARSISRPIRDLDAAARVLSSGKLDAPLPAPRGSDEIAQLTRSFGRMREDLNKYIHDLERTTAEKARIENDLETARTIQLDLLPSRFTFDPPRPEVDIYAMLEPARAVGGDFYDFFTGESDNIFVAVGDVSGKGVPAALFMAVSKAYLKAFAKETRDPARAVSELNDELAIENDEAMFLTVFCLSLDLKTGECRYGSGGHNPPFVLRRSGVVEELPQAKGPLIGLDAKKIFEAGHARLEPGDLLLAFSDGVVEAENSAQELYGEARAEDALSRLRGKNARAVVETIREDLRKFTGEAPQSDDITLLALRYLGTDGGLQ